ncbi:MAG: glycerate dehydrogenase [Gammaproteobacteria bacterium RBG_16_57_12]|nr:MAG: glycerate dehydrogenase [Gammaproteobacteria bacterium RBG_16_57_12]
MRFEVMRGVFLDCNSIDRGDLKLGALRASLPDWEFYPLTEPAQVHDRIRNAQVVISNKVVLDAAAMEAAAQLQLICVAATGTNNVDLATARQRGIAVCNVRGYATPSVVQHTFTLMLNLFTRIPEFHQTVMAGRWHNSNLFCLFDYPVRELAGKVLGIVGYGELGQAVARVAQAFDMEVIIAQRPLGQPAAGRLPLAELLPRVDVLSLHCPLTPQTRGLIGAAELALMKPTAVLINTARGGIVDEQALADALRAGRLAGAGVDVLSEEPPRHGSPLLNGDIPHLIVTPHIAWSSRESRQRLVDELVLNIEHFLRGNPRNAV